MGVGVGVRVGKGVRVGIGIGVGVTWRGGTSVTARLNPILTTISRLIIQSIMRVRRVFERRTVPPMFDCS